MSKLIHGEALRIATKRMVEEHFAYEAGLFDNIWAVCIEKLEKGALGETGTSTGDGYLGALGKHGDRSLDAMHYAEALLDAALTIQALGAHSQLSPSKMMDACKKAGEKLGIPKRIAKILMVHGSAALCEIHGIDVNPKTKAPSATPPPNSVWVEYNEKESDVVDASVLRSYMSIDKLDELLETRKDQFLLLIDERRPNLYIGGTKGPLLSEIERQERYFIGLILSHLVDGNGFISYDSIIEDVLGYDLSLREWESKNDRVRKLKSRVFKKLDRVLDNYISAVYRERKYEIRKAFTFCWIRKSESESILRL